MMTSRLAALATLAAIVASTPAFAQSADAATAAKHRSAAAAVSPNGQPGTVRGALYDTAVPAAPSANSNEPALTGGGSRGYNQNLYNY